MKTCIVALAVTFFGMATPTDVSGYWYLTLKTSDDKDAPRIEVALQQDGEKPTGNCFIDQADDKFILTCQVKENAINWRCGYRPSRSILQRHHQSDRERNHRFVDDASAGEGNLHGREKTAM